MPRINGFSKWTIDSLIHFSLPENEVLFTPHPHSPNPLYLQNSVPHKCHMKFFLCICVTVYVFLYPIAMMVSLGCDSVILHVACDWKDTSYITAQPFPRNPRIQYASSRPQPLLIFHFSLTLLLFDKHLGGRVALPPATGWPRKCSRCFERSIMERARKATVIY